MNRTIINMLKTLGEKEKKDWAKHLPKLAFAYNATVNSSTGYSPHFLLFGQEPRLPIDSVFETAEDQKKIRKSYEQYTEEWKRSMNQAFEIAKKHQEKAGARNKAYYDKKVCGVDLVVGNKVLSQNPEQGGTGKLRSYWESTVYTVVEKCADIPVFVIKPEGGGKTKRVHRNDLLKCNLILPLQEGEEQCGSPTPKKKHHVPEDTREDTRRSKRLKKIREQSGVAESGSPVVPKRTIKVSQSEESSDEESDQVVKVRRIM